MSMKSLAVAAVAICAAMPVFAEAIEVDGAYARSSGPNAKAGAAFMELRNTSGEEDKLVGARSDVAARVELHTHEDAGNGVMKMIELEDGITIPAGASHMMERGGDHVMFMGLKESLVQGETVTVTLEFEKAGDVELQIPVDLTK
ncbi:copper chaperone PCu(A)C [Actibacterium sp. 188UL27-1]|uniref:copper chaperone PCu(A)C n=1 Tax=Actibacterium sp. 188UL27-1 TaxID=2786961 RepID=UPI001958B849|nr:copper chaperone PCu(A)C [Actibacterium sp. 188UL27-1]MBM7066424.1 copper chaperone PCu(A)C [Actibacterium sp. 188UL27-1]